MTLSALDRALIRQMIPAWSIPQLVADPAAAVSARKASQSGGTAWLRLRALDSRLAYVRTTPSGLAACGASFDDVLHLTTWATVTRWARDLDPADVHQIREWLARHRQHQASFRRFQATDEALACGRTPAVGPLTYGQHLYAQQYAEWEREVGEPHYARSRDLATEGDRLYDALFVDTSPVQLDLLETPA